MRKTIARANANIALIKYWGKFDEENVIPYQPSISITLDNMYTVTTIEESDHFSFILNGKEEGESEKKKVFNFLLNFASIEEINKVKIISENFLPTAAGLASSSSGYAALSTSANNYFNKFYDLKTLANITRKGSGSACRSLVGGFVAWEVNGEVYQVGSVYDDFVIISVIINSNKKKISSREAMKITVKTSPFYENWVMETKRDFYKMIEAINSGNLDEIGRLTEKSYSLMHATMLSSNPPILYMSSESLKAIDLVLKMRNEGIYAYSTLDAGENVKILTRVSDVKKIIENLNNEGLTNLNISKMGEGAQVIYDSKV